MSDTEAPQATSQIVAADANVRVDLALIADLVQRGGRVLDVGCGTGVLATIGSTAPFVGLFGTVWGIMNSFIGISESQTTNLAVVAPGIAEALLATAIGLVAAIPAVVIYNVFARGITGYRLRLANALRDRLAAMMRQGQAVAPDMDPASARAAIYRLGRQTFEDRLVRAEAATA